MLQNKGLYARLYLVHRRYFYRISLLQYLLLQDLLLQAILLFFLVGVLPCISNWMGATYMYTVLGVLHVFLLLRGHISVICWNIDLYLWKRDRHYLYKICTISVSILWRISGIASTNLGITSTNYCYRSNVNIEYLKVAEFWNTDQKDQMISSETNWAVF